MNHYLKQIDGSLCVTCEGEKPKRQDYLVGDNVALVKEEFFIATRKWESEKTKHECHPSHIGEFLKLVSKPDYPLSEFHEDLKSGILIPSDRIKIEDGFAILLVEGQETWEDIDKKWNDSDMVNSTQDNIFKWLKLNYNPPTKIKK